MKANLNPPPEEVKRRQRATQKRLCEAGTDALFVCQPADLFYLSGTWEGDFLFLPAEGPSLFFFREKWGRAQPDCLTSEPIRLKSEKDIPGSIKDFYGWLPEVLGLELDVLPVKDFHLYRDLFQSQRYVDGSPLILAARRTKSEWEIVQMERTAELTRKTFAFMRESIHAGLTEMEFAAMCEAHAGELAQRRGRVRVRDYQTEGYPWHILSGRNGGLVGLLDSPASGKGTSAAFPCGAGHKPLAPNEPIMVDFSYEAFGYHMDETRMFALGSMPQKALQASLAAIEIHDFILSKVKPGVPIRELFLHSVSKAESLGYGEGYLGPSRYKVSFIGHGIGVELIEAPILAKNREDLLEPGMVFALEPKIVFENEFIAGIESVFTVTPGGHRLISKVPVEVFVV